MNRIFQNFNRRSILSQYISVYVVTFNLKNVGIGMNINRNSSQLGYMASLEFFLQLSISFFSE